MLSLETLREEPDVVQERLAARGYEVDLHTSVLPLDTDVRALSTHGDNLRHEKNQIANTLSAHYSGDQRLEDERVEELKNRATEIRTSIRDVDVERREISKLLLDRLLEIPNIPAPHTPEGLEYEDFQLVSVWGERPRLVKPVDHSEIGRALGIIDTDAGVRLAGPRFTVMHDRGARLQRAIMNFLLDHNTERGYQEQTIPYIVNPTSLRGTGQLPKFEQDVFATTVGEDRGRPMYLSPTTEVQLTNLVRDRIFNADELPMGLTGYSENFRAEAGNAGRDTTGILRQHQFPKVELVRFSLPNASWQEFERLTDDAESALQDLGIHYRKVALSAGDIAFQSAFTYDLEAWFPGQGKYREVSSCSNCTDFQARRIGARVINASTGEKEFIHTSNGSSLAIGRTLAAILEQGLQPDGSVAIPEALQDYTKFAKIEP